MSDSSSGSKDHFRLTLELLFDVCCLLAATAAEPEVFHTPERNEGLRGLAAKDFVGSEDLDLDLDLDLDDLDQDWDALPPRDFWPAFVKAVVAKATLAAREHGRAKDTLHVAAIDLRIRALGPASLRLGCRLCREDAIPGLDTENPWVQVACAHLFAIAGMPAMSTLADFIPGQTASVTTPKSAMVDMYALGRKEIMAAVFADVNPVAKLVHAKTFGGPVQYLYPDSVKLMNDIFSEVETEHGEGVAAMVRAAVETANQAMPGVDPLAILPSNPGVCEALVELVDHFEQLCKHVHVEGIAVDFYLISRWELPPKE